MYFNIIVTIIIIIFIVVVVVVVVIIIVVVIVIIIIITLILILFIAIGIYERISFLKFKMEHLVILLVCGLCEFQLSYSILYCLNAYHQQKSSGYHST